MASPLVRRLRVGATIRELRHKAGMSAEQLAKAAKLSRPEVSRLETAARKPDHNKVMDCLAALGVAENSPLWNTMIAVTRDANRRGWWEEAKYASMGERQQRYADVESGATWIGLYHGSLVPGLLQTSDFIAGRTKALAGAGVAVDPVDAVARLRRQQEVLHRGGPRIQAVLEEQVVRRLVVEPAVMVAQLRHLLDLAERYEQISIQVLPVECAFIEGHMPRSPLALHLFDDPDDGTAILLETVNDDLLMYDPEAVEPYSRLFERTRDAALSQADSAVFIAQTAARLAAS